MISLSFARRVSPREEGEGEPSSDTTNVHFDEKDGEMISKFQTLDLSVSRVCILSEIRERHTINLRFLTMKQKYTKTFIDKRKNLRSKLSVQDISKCAQLVSYV